MRAESHCRLGRYLADRYLSELSRYRINAFLIGCIEPDRNPATYLKGSLRFQWFRGHNYPNAKNYMTRISQRLEQKRKWNLYDWYTLGKLIHYTADAFTSPHNELFSQALSDHRSYEAKLQDYFLSYLHMSPSVSVRFSKTVMDTILDYHHDYEKEASAIHTDTAFALSACCSILAVLRVRPV